MTLLRAELAAVRWAPVAGGLVAAAVLGVMDLTIWPGGPGSPLLWLVAGLLGGSVAVALDDPAATLTDAVPTSRRRRMAVRLLVGLAGLAAWTAYVARVAEATSLPGQAVSLFALVLIGAALVLAATGAAAALGRVGAREPGSVVASIAVVSVLGLMILPLPGGLAAFDVSTWRSDATAAWSALAGLGLLALLVGTLDPWRRTPHP